MRIRAVLIGLLFVAAVAAGLSSPAQAAPEKIEGTIAFSAPIGDAMDGSHWDQIMCPDAGPADGSFYKFIDLKGDYTNLKLEGPARLVTDPSGTTGIGDYDLDIYVLDAKCKDLNHSNTSYPTEKFDGKKPARYVVVHYYIGPHPNLPFTLQAANERIK